MRQDGTIAPWIRGLSRFFDADVLQFSRLLSWELSHFDRFAAAEPLLDAIHRMHPEDVEACASFARCAAALDHWPEVEAATAATLAGVDREAAAQAELRYLRALALAPLGKRAEAFRELEWVRAHATAADLQAAAEAEARKLGPTRR